MGEENWYFMSTMAAIGTVMTFMVITNFIDKYMMVLTFILTILVFLGLIDSTYGLEPYLANKGAAMFSSEYILTAFMFIMFIYIQKRTHKEVFIEIKKKMELQNEFKIIFDEFEAAIFIMKNNQITHVNLTFNWFVFQHFGSETMQKISAFTNKYELNEMKKENVREQ